MATNYTSQQSYMAAPRSLMDLIGEAWRLFQAQAGTWIVTMLLIAVVTFVLRVLSLLVLGGPGIIAAAAAPAQPHGTTASTVLASYLSLAEGGSALIGVVSLCYLYCGSFNMANEQVRGRPINPGMVFQGYRLFLNMLGYSLLAGLASLISFACLIIPGFFVTPLFWPGYALIADGVPVNEALTRSMNGVKGNIGGAALLFFVFGLIFVVTAIPTCGLAELVTFPMSWLISALMYRDLIGMPMIAAPDPNGFYGAPQAGVWPPPPGANSSPISPDIYPPEPPIAPPPISPGESYPPPSDPYHPQADIDDPALSTGLQVPPTDPYVPPAEPDPNRDRGDQQGS